LWLLNTPGGVVDLHTGLLRPALREDYCTKTAKVAPGGKCPLWLKFLDDVTNGDKSLQAFLQRVCGYVLTGDTREHALFFLYGTGSNGKSVFLFIISCLLGDYARVAPIETFTATRNENHPTDVAGLHGARLVTVTETEEGRRWAESKIKQMTGGDLIATRFMRQDFFVFAPQFKLIISGNHRPSLNTVDEAMRRRIHLVPFAVTFSGQKRDKSLTKKLKAEWPGILRWAIEGCLAWQREELNPPQIVVDATDEYLAAEDTIGLWLEERTVKDPNAKASPTELYSDWKGWAEDKGVWVGDVRRFSQSMLQRGYKNSKGHGGSRAYKGIGLASPGRREEAGGPVTSPNRLPPKKPSMATILRPASSRRPTVGKSRKFSPRSTDYVQ
jgi:putative DNA primase/helicase